jgi:hypothetical protein
LEALYQLGQRILDSSTLNPERWCIAKQANRQDLFFVRYHAIYLSNECRGAMEIVEGDSQVALLYRQHKLVVASGIGGFGVREERPSLPWPGLRKKLQELDRLFHLVAVHPDRVVARDLVRGSVAIFARFATEGAPADGLSEVTRRGIDGLTADYDEGRHGEGDAPHARRLEDDFIDRFALVGTPDEVLERLAEIATLGVERVVLVPGSLDADPALVAEANDLFAAEVLPHMSALG